MIHKFLTYALAEKIAEEKNAALSGARRLAS